MLYAAMVFWGYGVRRVCFAYASGDSKFQFGRKESYCGLGDVKAFSGLCGFLVHALDVQLHSNMCLCMIIRVSGKNNLV